MNGKHYGTCRAWELPGLGLLVTILTLSGCGTNIKAPSSTAPGGTAAAQSQPAAGPTLGYVWDSGTQSLRPVQGVTGASILGPAAISAAGQGYIAAAWSSATGAALFLDSKGGVYQAPLTGGALRRIASLPGAASLALSNSGSYALVTGPGTSLGSVAALISGLPQAPSIRTLNPFATAASASSASIVGGAISDTGTAALALGGDGAVSVVAFVGPAAAARIATAQAFGGMQFVPNSDELVVADKASGAVTAISQVNTIPAATVLSAGGALTAPVSLDVTSNGRWVVAASHSGDVLRLDLTGTTPAAKVHCTCAPVGVLALGGAGSASTVRLLTSGAGPLWMMEAGATALRVSFTPPLAPVQATSASNKNAL